MSASTNELGNQTYSSFTPLNLATAFLVGCLIYVTLNLYDIYSGNCATVVDALSNLNKPNTIKIILQYLFSRRVAISTLEIGIFAYLFLKFKTNSLGWPDLRSIAKGNSWLRLAANLALGGLFYATLSLYYNDCLLVVELFGEDFPLNLFRALWFPFAHRPLAALLEWGALSYCLNKVRSWHLDWSERLLILMATLFMLLGRIYNRGESLHCLHASTNSIIICLLCAIGIYFMLAILFIAGEKAVNYFFHQDRQTSEGSTQSGNSLTSISEFFRKHLFLASWFSIAFSWTLLALARYPGGMEWDAYFQVEEYFGIWSWTTNWPLASSFFMGFMIDLGSILFGSMGRGLFFLIVVQILICSAIMASTIWVNNELKLPMRWQWLLTLFYSISIIYSSYAACAIKDTLYSYMVVLLTVLTGIILFGNREENSFYIYTGLVAFLVCILRNNGFALILSAALASIAIAFRKKDTRHKKLGLTFALALTCFCLYTAYFVYFLKIPVGPNGGMRELLSLPFQQTARYVKYHGSEISPQETAVFERIFTNYDRLGLTYVPYKSDSVRRLYTSANNLLPTYFQVWLKQMVKHPLTYIAATTNNLYGFLYIDANTFLVYNDVLDFGDLKYNNNSFYGMDRNWLNAVLELFWRSPLLNLACSSALAFFVTLHLFIVSVKKRNIQMLCLMTPSLVSLLTCLTLATFYTGGLRFTLPTVYVLPFVLGLSQLPQKTE